MKKLTNYLFLLLFVSAFTFTSCKDDENKVETPAIETLAKYLTDNNLDLPAIISGQDGTVKFVTGAPATDADVAAWAAGYYIMDIRGATDYAAGHITGAINVTFANILEEASNAGDKKILMVCYTGQTACYATSLLRLYGYPTTQALKWGMSGWNSATDKWTANTKDIAVGHANWNTNAAPAVGTYNYPSISSNATEGEAILKARVEAAVTAGFKTVSGNDVLTTPGNYFINNYFSETDYNAFGHFDGAQRINPLSIAGDLLKGLDPSKKIVTYCYTGQTSAVITAYLNVLGYDAVSLLFGMNGLNNSSDAWSSNQWGGDSNPKSLSTVTK